MELRAAEHLPSTEATPPAAHPAKAERSGTAVFSRAEAAKPEKTKPEPVAAAKPAQPVTVTRKASAVAPSQPAAKEKDKPGKIEKTAADKDKPEKGAVSPGRSSPLRDKTSIELAQPALPLHPAKPSFTAISGAKLGKNPPRPPKEKEKEKDPAIANAAPAIPVKPGTQSAIPTSFEDMPKGIDPFEKPVLPKLPPRSAPPTGSLPRATASTTPPASSAGHGHGNSNDTDPDSAPSTSADINEPAPPPVPTGPVMPKLLPPSAVAVDPTRPLKQLLPVKPKPKIMAALPVDKTAPVYMPPLSVNPATRVMAPLPVVPVAEPNYKVTIPELVDDVPPPSPNDPLMEARQKKVLQRNLAAMRTMRMADPAKLKEVCRAKIASATTPSSLKLLYASLLTLAGEPAGRDYLRVSLTNVNGPALADTMWTFNFIALESDVLRGGQRPDLSWAEDLMVAAMKDKRPIATAKIFPTVPPVPGKPAAGPLQNTMPTTVQVRELAVMTGRFQDILAAARSRRLPTVLVDWARENPPPSDLSPFLLPLGTYDYDTKAEAFVLERVISHNKDFGAAVAAAIRMDLKDAVPHLMKNLSDPRAQSGLLRLGDLRIVRPLKQAMVKMSREERPAIEMLIIRLSTNDPLPAMLDYVEDTKCPARSVALAYMDEITDARAIPAAAFMMKEDPDPQARVTAIRCLTRIARTGNREALHALMEGLEVRFERLPGTVNEKAMANAMYRGEIAETLRSLTRQNYGLDANGWYAWYKQGDAAPGANSRETAIASNSAPRPASQQPFGSLPGDLDTHGNPETDALPQGETMPAPGYEEQGITYAPPDGTPGDDNTLPSHDAPEAPTPPSLVPRKTDPFAPAWPLAYTPAPDPNAPANGDADTEDYPRRDESLRWSTRLQVGSRPGNGSRNKVPAAELAKLQGPPVPEALSRPVTYMMASAPEMVSGPPTPGSFYARVFAKSNQYHMDGVTGNAGTADGNGADHKGGSAIAANAATPGKSGGPDGLTQVAAAKPEKAKEDRTNRSVASARRSMDAMMRPPRELAAAFRDMEDAMKQGPPVPVLTVPSSPVLVKADAQEEPEPDNGAPTLASLQKPTTPYNPAKDAPEEAKPEMAPAIVETTDVPGVTIVAVAPLPGSTASASPTASSDMDSIPPTASTSSPAQVPAPAPAPQEVLVASPGSPVLPPVNDEPAETPERRKMLAALAESKALAAAAEKKKAEHDAMAATAPAPTTPAEMHAQADIVVPEPNEKLADFLAEAGTPIMAAPNRAFLQRRATEALAAAQPDPTGAAISTAVSKLNPKDRKKVGASPESETEGDNPTGLRFPIQPRGNLLSIREEYTPMPPDNHDNHGEHNAPDGTPAGQSATPGQGGATNAAPAPISRADALDQASVTPAPRPADSSASPAPATTSTTTTHASTAVPAANAPSATMLAEAGTPIAIPGANNTRGDGNGGPSTPTPASAPASTFGGGDSAKAAPSPSYSGTTLSRIFTELVLKPQSPSAGSPTPPSVPSPTNSAKPGPDSDLPPTAAPLMQLLDDAGKAAPESR